MISLKPLAALLLALPLRAQGVTPPSWVDVGSQRENSLRLLQLIGDAPSYPWSIRPFSPAEARLLTPQITRELWPEPPEPWRSQGPVAWQVLETKAGAIYNSAFPYGINDGPVWAGRGVTFAVQGGAAMRTGPLSVQLEPLIFVAQNAAFPIQPTGRVGPGIYGNEFSPLDIDAPQRFGDKHYARLDMGNSAIRLDAGPVAMSYSNANQFWGPAIENPLILGDNAPGFPHVFVGTSHPLPIGIGRVHGRIVWGRLDQTPYAPKAGTLARRFMSGLVGVFEPAGLNDLELGFSRFLHNPWPDSGLSHARFFRPFDELLGRRLKQGDASGAGDAGGNQLASLFFRWVFPRSRLEIYGEYGREDHFGSLRDLIMEVDHSAAYLLGFQRGWRRTPADLWVLRAEVMDSRIAHLRQSREEAPWYSHTTQTQGHTEIGQVLGSAGAFGGGASVLALERFTPSGTWTVRLSRLMRAQAGIGDSSVANLVPQLPNPASADVIHTLGFERVRRRRRFEVTTGVNAVWNLNRNFRQDQFDLNLVVGLRAR
jgi:hypothetical protein